MVNLIRDLRYALRTLGCNPGFTAVAAGALALGIGVNTSIFSLYNALALRPLPVKDPGRVARLYRTTRGEPGAGVFSYPEYKDYRDGNPVLSDLAAWTWTGMSMGTGDHAEAVRGMLVSGNYFDVLGADAVTGRTFVPEEDSTPGAQAVAVLSESFWERRFARNRAIVGRSVLLNGHPFTVVGVVGRQFAGTDAEAPEAWVPLMMKTTLAPESQGIFEARDGHWLQLIGRLKPGVSWMQARAAMDVRAHQLAQTYPEEKKSGVMLAGATFLPPNVEKSATPVVILIMGAVGLVLLIACANVANLLLARSAGRHKEIGIRVSLGATRGRLVRQLLTESLVLALLGGTAGLVLASWASAVVLRVVTPPLSGSLNFNVSPDIRVLAYAFSVSVLTGIIFGLIPALEASKPGVSELIKSAGLMRRRTWASDSLVVAQVGLCVVLLVAGGLLLRGLRRAQRTDPGFETKHVVAITLDLRLQHHQEAAAVAFVRRMTEQMRAVGGVKAASLAEIVPLGTASMSTNLEIEGHEMKADAPPIIVSQNVVSPEFFETLGIPVMRGRGFENDDWKSEPETVMVNETAAQRFWPGQDAMGKRVKVSPSKVYAVVVGVVKNTRSSYLWDADEPYIYTPMKAENNPGPDAHILVRTAGDPLPLVGALTGIVRAADRNVRVSSKVLDENLAIWIWPSQVGATLAASFGLLALALAAVGIYGVVAYTVGRRTREIGIHVALGAQRGDVLRMVLGRGMLLVGTGVIVGMAMAFAASRLIARFLYGLNPGDPVTFGAVAAVLAAVAIVANYVPARRALLVDPMVALRYE